MTSFIINAHVNRQVTPDWRDTSHCPFCYIIQGSSSAHRVYEDDKVVAILDILPLRPGHTLVIPKIHCPRLSDLPPDFAAAVGQAVSKVAHALTQALDNTALNVVCNQEYAQAVPHVHYHIIPAPTFGQSSNGGKGVEHVEKTLSTGLFACKDMHQREFESRSELDDDDGDALAAKIRARL
ncbi:hypothetical protein SERLA73DRAFT_91215 [Serpula lacrymans var. lacrymans S7.3]|uniref:HIT domain-containing protein n=2 Tax=Serpula lacrymans var. lacrymans TaxID=341189 RepID=F8Q148_SERL3|nr:uncharacterized protein SERLADRAFT_356498 [Serpula lacrymans var. lacrymans S7.9]EGN98026.1 hypothetical protein SERLA73DRAFT_91215 [Serpula lacrymans var. lacrymans S7.3]EGO23616.1 hypothetical protein SERLADRAFT_356498 [Serpula lacrymans var. lacrymans S7.9]